MISGEVANLQLVYTFALSKQKGYSCHFAATFAKINKEMNKICFSRHKFSFNLKTVGV